MSDIQQSNASAFSMKSMSFFATPLGVVRLGVVADVDGFDVPVANDEFTVTGLTREGNEWVRDPLDTQLRPQEQAPGQDASADRPSPKLREIPIQFLCNDPSLSIRSRLQAFNTRTQRPVCSSDGSGHAKRLGDSGTVDVECVGPDLCSFAAQDGVACKFFGRVNFQIRGQASSLGQYILRSSSYNTLRTLEAKARQFHALLGRRLRGVNFKLVMRSAANAQSQWTPFYFVDLELESGTLVDAARAAKTTADAESAGGLAIDELEAVIRNGLDNGPLEGDPTLDLREFFVEQPLKTDQATRRIEAQRPLPSGNGVLVANFAPTPALHQ
jgi:hypothetical protein